MIVSFTGHRSVGGFKYPNTTYNQVCQETERILKELKPDKAFSGFAIGFDSIAAYICHKLGINFSAAIPFSGQELKWPIQSQKAYHQLLNLAVEKVIISPGGYSPEKMQIRNQFLVDQCDILIAYFNGMRGGTYNCVKYAEKIGREIIFINPQP